MNVVISASKPPLEGYPEKFCTVGDHIRQERLKSRLLQREVAEIIRVPEGVVQQWECRGHEPEMRYWPGIIFFLGYERYTRPETTAEKVKVIRRRLGLTSREFAKRIQADPGAIARWEAGGEIRKGRHQKAVAELLASTG